MSYAFKRSVVYIAAILLIAGCGGTGDGAHSAPAGSANVTSNSGVMQGYVEPTYIPNGMMLLANKKGEFVQLFERAETRKAVLSAGTAVGPLRCDGGKITLLASRPVCLAGHIDAGVGRAIWDDSGYRVSMDCFGLPLDEIERVINGAVIVDQARWEAYREEQMRK